MAEVVGTAYVRIRAITTGLSKDIKDGLDSGMADFGGDVDIPQGFKDNINKGMEEAGEEGGKSFHKGIRDQDKKETDKTTKGSLKRFSNSLKKNAIPGKVWAIALGIPGLGAVLKLAGSYVITLVGQLGYIVTAAVGAGAALGGIFAAAGLAALPLVLAFKAQSEALDEFNESIKQTGRAWLEVGIQAQIGLLPALDRAFERTTKLIPLFSEFAGEIGTIAGKAAEGAVSLLTSGENMELWGGILDGAAAVFQNLMDTITPLVGALVPILAAIMPLAVRMSESFQKMAENFYSFIQAGSESGSLTATLSEWYDRAESIGRSIWNIIEALWEILTVGGDSVSPMFENLETTTQKWVDWLRSAEGEGKLKAIFDAAMPVAREINGLVGDIIELLGEKIVAPGGTEGIITFLQALRNDFLPAVSTLAEALGENLAGGLGDLALSFVDLITALAESGALGTFTRVLGDFIEQLVELMKIPGVGDVVAKLAVAFGTWSAIKFAAKPFVKVAEGVKGANDALKLFSNSSFLKILKSGGITGLLRAAGTAFVTFFSTLATSIIPLLPVIAIVAAIVAVAYGIYWAIKNWDKILPVLKKVWEAISTFFVDLWNTISDFFEGIGDWVAEKWTAFIDFFENLPGEIGDALGDLGQEFVDFFSGIGDWIAEAWTGFIDFFEELPGRIGKFLLGIVTAIVTWVASLPGLFLNAITAMWKWIVDAVPKAIGAVVDFIANLIGFLIMLPFNIGTAMVEAAIALWKWIADAVPMALEWLGNLATTVWDWVTETVTGLVTRVVAFYTGIIQWIIDAVVAFPKNLANLAKTVWDWITKTASEIVRRVSAFLTGVISWIVDAIVQFPQNLANLATKIWNWITETAASLVTRALAIRDAILGWIGDAAGKVAGKLGEFASNVWNWIVDFVGGLPEKFSNAITSFLSFGKDLFNAVKDGIMDGIGAIGEFGSKLMQKIKESLVKYAPDWMKGWLRGFLGTGNAGAGPGEEPTATATAAAATMSAGVRRGSGNLAGAVAPVMSPMGSSGGGGGVGAFAAAFGAPSLMAMAVPAALGGGVVDQFTRQTLSGMAPINLVVTIGETDITDLVDARISSNDRATAQALWVKRR